MSETYAEVIPFPSAQQLGDVAMAAGAEYLAAVPATEALQHPPVLSLVQLEVQELAEVIPLYPYPEVEFRQPCAANAEIFDDLAETMHEARQVARGILEGNKRKLLDGDF